MNINSRIDWRDGLDLTPNTFIAFEDRITRREQTLTQILSGSLLGIVPYSQFMCEASFVNKNIEIPRFCGLLLLASGQIIQIDEPVVLPVPMLYGDEYYLTLKVGTESRSYEHQNIPVTSPKYIYEIKTLTDIKSNKSLFPILRFKVDDGYFSIDSDYIPPYLHLESCPKFGEFISKILPIVTNIAEHANFEMGDGQRTFLRYAFMMERYNLSNKVQDFIALTIEIALAIDYYIAKPNNQTPATFEECSIYDIEKWLRFFEGYLIGAISILDKVVLVDNTIDMEQLKAEIKAELYDSIYGKLYESLYSELSTKLRDEIYNDIKDVITTYINTTLKDSLRAELDIELNKRLSKTLFRDLYDALYEALYVKPEEQEEFTPMM